MAGARPTLTGVTDDSSRGGLFVQSNVANPVSGADVTGTVVNDSEITLSITIDGDTQTGSFRTNAASDGTVQLTFTGVGGSSAGTGGPVVTGGRFDPATNMLILERSNNQPDLMIDGWVFPTRTDQEINDLADARIGAANISDLNNVPALGDPGNVLRVSSTTGQTEWVRPDTASVSDSSFTSTGGTVAITPNGAQVNLESRPEWVGNNGNAPSGTTTVLDGIDVEVGQLTLNADTGLVLVRSGGNNFELRAAAPDPTPASAPTTTTPLPSSAIDPSPAQTITFRGAGGDTVTMLEMTSVTDPAGDIVMGVTESVTGGVGMIMIPSGATNAPGNYQTVSDVTTMSADGQTRTSRETETIERFVPFYQSRMEPSSANAIVLGTASDAAWSGSLTAIPGSGLLYISALQNVLPQTTAFADQANFPVRVSFVGSFNVSLADGTSPAFNVFRVPGGAGQTISNFRSTR